MAFIPRVIEKLLDMINLQRHNDNYADIKTELDKSDAHIGNSAVHTTQIEKDKLAGIQAGAQVNPGAATTSAAGLMSAADKSKLDGVAAGANNYTHPSSHPPSIIVQDTGNRFVTDTEKATWNAKAGTTTATVSTDGLMSAADKTKLNGIAAGAEVNQTAFGNINGIAAQAKTDSLDIVGDIGLTVTTDPVNKQIKLTVTGEAAPGAHAITHLPGGSDPIPTATTSTGGLMSAQDKQDLTAAKTAIAEGQTIPAPIQRGVNVIQSDQASGATFRVIGCTLCNILGRDGGCESLTPFQTFGTVELSTTQKRSGINAIKVTASASTSTFYKDYAYVLDATKQYLFGCWVYIESYTSGTINVSLRDAGTNTSRYAASVNTSLVGQWQFVPLKVPTANVLVGNGFRTLLGVTTATAIVYFDEIRLYELSAADYAAIGTTITGEAIDRRWPYVDSVQHTRGLSVMMPGKNLLKGAPDATLPEMVLNAPYDFSMTRSSTGLNTITVDVKPGTVYTLKADHSGYMNVRRGVSGAVISGTSSQTLTFNTDIETKVTIGLGVNGAGSVSFKNWMLVLGGADQLPASFTPYNPTYANADTILASNVDRTIADSYDSATGQIFRRLVIGLKMDGLKDVGLEGVYTGYKRLYQNIAVPTNTIQHQNAVRFDGLVLQRYGPAPIAADHFVITTSDNRVYLSVGNTLSGWVDAVAPNSNARKGLCNGWRANGNNGSIYNSWVSILTGEAPTTNTEAYVAANKAPGWDAYATLDYVRATPITEQLSGDLGGLNVVKGGNQVELMEGVVVRERAYPKLDGSGWYIMSADSTEFWGSSRVKYTTRKFLSVYKGMELDSSWRAVSGPPTFISANSARYTAAEIAANEWYVDYIVLDKHSYTANVVDATLIYRSTLGGAVAQATQDIAKLQQHNGVQDFALDYIEAKADNNAHDLVQRNSYGTTAGTATAYTLTLTPAPQLVEGMRVMVKLHVDNGANPTLNVNGTGAQAIRKPNGSAPAAGLLKSGSVYTLVYNGTAFTLQGEGGEYGTAVAAEVLAGKTIGTDAGIVTGTMPDRSSQEPDAISTFLFNPGTGNRVYLKPPTGYYPGSGSFGNVRSAAQPDLIAANIRAGTSIFGLVGTLIEGKRWAQGTSPLQHFDRYHKITITGLSFQPSFIFVSTSGINAPLSSAWASISPQFTGGILTNKYPDTSSGYIRMQENGAQGTGNDQFQITANGAEIVVYYDSGAGVPTASPAWWAFE
ncbi:hypothetical protein ACX93W_05185 [Paenibacillus sp. CAU 1782]